MKRFFIALCVSLVAVSSIAYAITKTPAKDITTDVSGWGQNIPTTATDVQAALTALNAAPFITGVSWGSIGGVLSNQTDLQSALNAKASTSTTISTTAPLSGGGDLSANRTLSITQSGVATDGYLSSTDWNTFNNKQPSGTYVSSVSGTSPVVSSGGVTPSISIPAATGSVDGYLTSSDWTTFNSKQASGSYITALTGDVTASGPGSVASTLSSTYKGWELSGANVSTAGSYNVGIGTSNPTALLHVKGGNVQLEGYNFIADNDSGLRDAGSQNSRYNVSSTKGLVMLTSGTERVRIDTSGNVGVGSSNPGKLLDVAGAIRMTSAGGLTFSDNTTQTTAASSTNPGGSSTQLQYNNGGSFGGVTGSGVDSNGNVGVGSVNPTQKLDIEGTAQAQAFELQGYSTSTPALFPSTDTNTGVRFSGPDILQLETGGSAGITITSAQNVGVGTSVVNSKLAVNGGAVVGTGYMATVAPTNGLIVQGNVGIGSVNPVGLLDIQSATNPQLVIGDGAGNNSGWRFNTTSGLFTKSNYPLTVTGGLQVTNTANAPSYILGSGGVGIGTTITSNAGLSIMNGNVGIGTWKPIAALDVRSPGLIYSQNGIATNTLIGYSANNITFGDGTSSFGIVGSTSKGVNFSGGNVGIGTTLPSAPLEVLASGGTGAKFQGTVKFTDPASQTIDNVTITGNSSAGQIKVNGSNSQARVDIFADNNGGIGIGTTRAFVNGNAALSVMSGNVGIGTWKPVGILDIKSSGDQDVYLPPRSGKLYIGESGNAVYLQESLGLIIRGDSTHPIKLTNANVGIGSANPSALLDVDVNTGSIATGLALTNSATNATIGRGSQILFKGTGGGSLANVIGATDTATNNYGKFQIQTASAGTLATRVTVDSTGNVGIGSTNPGALLDVTGTARMTGFKLSTTPTNGYVLTSDASGNGTWQAAGGGTSSQWLTNGNVGIGTYSNVGIGTIDSSNTLQVQGTSVIGPAGCAATGGTITSSGGYTIHTFTSSGTLTVSAGCTNAEYLIVGGGGAGGGSTSGGGGGAGGLLSGTGATLTVQAYTVTVGAGGTGGSAISGTAGGNSSFNSLTALGGAGGTTTAAAPATGGSGGAPGGCYLQNVTGGLGTAGQGNNSGNCVNAGADIVSGGGGGSGAVGGNSDATHSGTGGTGTNSSISGSTVMYACGGGGGSRASQGVTAGLAGCSSAGAGNGAIGGTGGAATANSGSGGGGGGQFGPATGGAGGSGIVIVRYPSVNYFKVSSSGNVGIGVVAPSSGLDVNSSGIAVGSYAGTSSAPSNGMIISGNLGIGTSNPKGGLTVMNGNVGIGTWVPTSPLTIKGTTVLQKLSGANTACNTTCGAYACFFGSDTGSSNAQVDCADAAADVCFCSK